MPRNVVQFWINTGYLPYQSYINDIEYSDTGSSLSEEECLYETHATTNTMNTLKLNNEQLCNDSSTNSSVDTAAYILSNMNITRKENLCSKLIMREVTNMHKDRNYKYDDLINAVNIYNTVNSSISKKMCISDVCTNDKMYKNDKLEKTNITKEHNEIKLSTPHIEDINEICKDDKTLNKNNLNRQDEERLLDSTMEKTGNISNNNTQISHLESFRNDFISHFRQRKLYTGRDSPTPTDIEITQYKTNISPQKRFLHPALEDNSTFQKPHKRFKWKRKHTILNTFITRKPDDSVTSNNKRKYDTDEDKHIAKRQKTAEDIENNVNTNSLNTTEERSYQSYNLLLRKQLKKFSTVRHMDKKKLKGTKLILTRKKVKKMTRKGMKAKTPLRNKSYKKLNPVIVLERLSKEIIRNYIKEKDLQSEIQETNDIQITDMNQNTNEFSIDECSLNTKDTSTSVEGNVFVDSADSDASTIILFNCQNTELESRVQNPLSLCTPNEKQLENILRDKKLTEKEAVVVLERLCSTKPINKTLPMISHKKKELKSSNILKNKLEPVVILERLILDPFINLEKKSSHNKNSFTSNGLNKTNANKKETYEQIQMHKKNAIMKEKINHSCKNNKRLTFLQTSTYNSDSDSDSNVSSSHLTIIKCNTTTTNEINKKSSKPSKTNTLEDTKSIKSNKKVSSRNVSKQTLNNKRTLRHNSSNTHALTNTKSNILTRASARNKVSHLSNSIDKIDNNQQICTSADVFKNDTSKNENIYKNNNTNVINKNMNDKAKRFTLCTKAYDSDSD